MFQDIVLQAPTVELPRLNIDDAFRARNIPLALELLKSEPNQEKKSQYLRRAAELTFSLDRTLFVQNIEMFSSQAWYGEFWKGREVQALPFASTLRELPEGAKVVERGFDQIKEIDSPGLITSSSWHPRIREFLEACAVKKVGGLFKFSGEVLAIDKDWGKEFLLRNVARYAEEILRSAAFILEHDSSPEKILANDLINRALDTIRPDRALAVSPQIFSLSPERAPEIIQRSIEAEKETIQTHLSPLLSTPEGRRMFLEFAHKSPELLVISVIWQFEYGSEPGHRRFLAVTESLDDPKISKIQEYVAAIADRAIESHRRLDVGPGSDITQYLNFYAAITPSVLDEHVSFSKASKLIDDHMKYRIGVYLGKDTSPYPREYFHLLAECDNDNFKMIHNALRQESLALLTRFNNRYQEPPEQRFRELRNFSAMDLTKLLVRGESEIRRNNLAMNSPTTISSLLQRIEDRVRREYPRDPLRFFSALPREDRLEFLGSLFSLGRQEFFQNVGLSTESFETILRESAEGLEKVRNPEKLALALSDYIHGASSDRMLKIFDELFVAEHRRIKEKIPSQLYGLLAADLAREMTKRGISPSGNLKAIAETFGPFLRSPQERETLPTEKLFTKGVHVQRYFFYSDEDGVSSYASLRQTYLRTPSLWKVSEREGFLHIESRNGKVHLFANTPHLKPSQFDDLNDGRSGKKTSDQLTQEALQRIGIQPQIVVHRGHANHASHTIHRVNNKNALAFLGGCGGSALFLDVLERNPDIQVVSTTGTGTMRVNDPLLFLINARIAQGQSIHWPTLWTQAEKLLSTNEHFSKYEPPHASTRLEFARALMKLKDAKSEEQ